MGHLTGQRDEPTLGHYVDARVPERARFPVLSLAFSQFLQCDLLLNSLITLKKIARSDKLFQIFGFNPISETESFDFGFTNDSFSRDFEDAFRLLARVVWRLDRLGVLSELPGVAAGLVEVLALVDVE